MNIYAEAALDTMFLLNYMNTNANAARKDEVEL